MRTIRFNVFSFEELDEQVQARVLGWQKSSRWRETNERLTDEQARAMIAPESLFHANGEGYQRSKRETIDETTNSLVPVLNEYIASLRQDAASRAKQAKTGSPLSSMAEDATEGEIARKLRSIANQLTKLVERHGMQK